MIIKEEIFIEPFNLSRMLHIYIPDEIKKGERFPVLYMFDGHNLFFDEDATYGKSWGIKNFLDKAFLYSKLFFTPLIYWYNTYFSISCRRKLWITFIEK